MYLLYFFAYLSYNYNGDSMNRESIILNIHNMDDINKLKNSNIKYLNLDIEKIDNEVINFLKENGHNYLYSESIKDRNGYIYVDYETFFNGEKIINNIISSMPSNLNKLEIAKYLYVSLGKILGYDINIIPEKNEVFNLNRINTINNIWGALTNLKITNVSVCKIYLYLCSLFDIKCDIITISNKGFLCNKLTIDEKTLIVDLTNDIPFIEAGFKTRFFDKYNEELELDKKIGYINDEYNEIKIDKLLKNIDYNNDEFVFNFLLETQNVLEVYNIKPIELGIIYDMLFHKYCPSANININNLYLHNIYNNKEHFILISYKEYRYSYNYNKKTFMKINEKDLINNLENEKIGIYLNEEIPKINKYKEVV